MTRNRLLVTTLALALVLSLSPVHHGWGYTGTKRVLILPFKLNAPQDLTYLQQGIYDMLSSRIEYGDKVSVVSRAEAHQAYQKVDGNVNESTARSLGGGLGADFVLFGSITVIGQNVSLDASMVDLKGVQPPVGVHHQSAGMDGVIPKINGFAEEINQRVFGRDSRSSQSAQSYGAPQTDTQPLPRKTEPLPAYRRHPDYLLTGQEGKLGSSSVNPNFIAEGGPEVTTSGFWQSPSYQFKINGLDVGDVDGDRRNEIVYADGTTIFVARLENKRLIQVANYQGVVSNRILTLDLADLNGNGQPELFVTCQNNMRASSLILEMRGDRLIPLVENFPYYMRKTHLPDGPVILAQRSGTSDMFYGGVKVLGYSGGRYVTGGNVHLPQKANVFNFAQGDFEGTGQNLFAVVNEEDRLQILSSGGEMIWSSKGRYCGTTIAVNKQTSTFASDNLGPDKDKRDKFYIPASIVVEDIDGDGKKDIVVARNEEGTTAKLLSSWRSFKYASMHSFTYGQLSMRENWRTREMTGGLVDYCIKDYNNNGTPDLIMALVRSQGTAITDAKSTIVAFELSKGK